MRRNWLKNLLAEPKANRRVSTPLNVVQLEGREMPAIVLPDFFVAGSGIHQNGKDILAGSESGRPAYVQIDGSTVSTVTILPSLSVVANGAGGNPAGSVQDVIRNTEGQVMFVGASHSTTSRSNGEGEASTWIFGTNLPTGYGYTNILDGSSMFGSGNSSGNYVGTSNGNALYVDGAIAVLPVRVGEAISIAISADSKYIVGVDGTYSAAWKRNTSGNYELITNLEAPTPGGPLGSMSGVVGKYAAGQYFNGEYNGAIWDLDTGEMIRDFSAYGGVDSLVEFQQIGNEFVAIFSSIEGKSPLVHLFHANRTFELATLPEFGAVGGIPGTNTINRVTDIWQRPNGALGLSYIGIDGKWYFESVAKNDHEERWDAPLEDGPAIALPTGFTASSGIRDTTGDIVAGTYLGKPAYLNINNGITSSVTTLPSLSVVANGPNGDATGLVQDVIRNLSGEIIFLGTSQSNTSSINSFGEGSIWDLETNTPQGYGYVSNGNDSLIVSGNNSNHFIGTSNGTPAFWNGQNLSVLSVTSTQSGSMGLAISADSKYIVGVDGPNSVAWKRNTSGNYELITNLEAPTPGGPLGFMSGVVNNFAAGQYFNGESVGAIWNLDTGEIIRDFSAYGGVDSLVDFQQIGNEFVAIFSSTEGKSPLVHLFHANRTFELATLPELGGFQGASGTNTINRVSDIWQRPGGALGLSYLGTDGEWYFDSLLVNDRGEPWTTGPSSQPPTNLQLTGNSVTEGLPVGTVVGTLSATDPDGDALTFTIQTAGVPFEIVGNQLRTTAVLDYENQPSYVVNVRATDSHGAFAEKEFTINVNDVVQIMGIKVNGGGQGRSTLRTVEVTFDGINGVQALLQSGKLRFRRDGFSGNLALPPYTIVGNSVIFTINNRAGYNVNGVYRLQFDADANGSFETTRLVANRLYGDVTGDGRVNLADLNAMATWRSRPYNLDLDVNGDRRLNLTDVLAMYTLLYGRHRTRFWW